MTYDTGKVKLPSLPTVTTGNPAMDRWMQAVTERLEVREGVRGNPMERVVTLRELSALGIDAQAMANVSSTTAAGVVVQLPGGGFSRVPLDTFSEELRKTKLYADLMRSIDDAGRFDEVPEQVRTLLLGSIAEEAARRGADIRHVETRLQSATQSLAFTVDEVTAAVTSASAGVREVSYASTTANLATAGKVTQVQARLDEAAIDPADILPTVYATLSALQAAVPVGVPGKYYQVAGTPKVLYRWNGSAYVVGGAGTTATVEQKLAASVDRDKGAEAQYTLKVSAGGALAGFGLAATNSGGTPSSAFIISADKFAVVSPSYTGGLTNAPNVANVPFGVDASGAYIKGTLRIDTSGTTAGSLITSVTTAQNTATKAQDAATKAQDAATTANDAAGTAQTTANAATAALTGKLNKAGADTMVGPISLQASNAILVGTVNDGLYLGSTGLVGRKASQTTFSIAADGTAVFAGELSAAKGTFAGALDAAKGTFSGELKAATGTFSGELKAATGSFYGALDTNGTTAGSLITSIGTANDAATKAQTTATTANNAATTAQTTANDATTALTGKLNKSGADTMVGPISLTASNAILVGTVNDGLYMGSTGLVGRKASQTTFSIAADGTAVFAGSLSAATGTFSGELKAATGSFYGALDTKGTTAGSLITSIGDANSAATKAQTTATTASDAAAAAQSAATAAQTTANTANTNLADKLSKSGADTMVGPISLATSNAILVGTVNDGLYLGSTGLVGRKASATTFSISADGTALFAGALSAATGTFAGSVATTGTIDVAGNGTVSSYAASAHFNKSATAPNGVVSYAGTGTAVFGLGSSGAGVNASATSGTGLVSSSGTGSALTASNTSSTAPTVLVSAAYGFPAISANGPTTAIEVTNGKIVSTVATGTAPISVSSTTKCPNLNATYWDGVSMLGTFDDGTAALPVAHVPVPGLTYSAVKWLKITVAGITGYIPVYI